MSLPLEPTDEQRDELVEQVAREIQLRGLTGPAGIELLIARLEDLDEDISWDA